MGRPLRRSRSFAFAVGARSFTSSVGLLQSCCITFYNIAKSAGASPHGHLQHCRTDAGRMTDASVHITKKAEEACLYKLKQYALKKKCGEVSTAYAECCKGRSFSMVWACKPALNDLNNCLKQSTRRDIQQELFRRYAAAGRPERPDWDALLEGL